MAEPVLNVRSESRTDVGLESEALIAGVTVSYIGYWRTRRLPGQEWRLPLAPWKFILDATNVAAVHALIAALGTVAVFVLLSLSFRGVTFDGWVSAASIGAAAALSIYWIYVSVSKIDTGKLSTLLVVFISVTTLTSMATAPDPKWWEYHFSLLAPSATAPPGSSTSRSSSPACS